MVLQGQARITKEPLRIPNRIEPPRDVVDSSGAKDNAMEFSTLDVVAGVELSSHEVSTTSWGCDVTGILPLVQCLFDCFFEIGRSLDRIEANVVSYYVAGR